MLVMEKKQRYSLQQVESLLNKLRVVEIQTTLVKAKTG